MGRPAAAVIGGGPAGLMAAEVLSRGGAAVTLYDRMPSFGRKFLLAGRGGLNLTHSEPFDRFVARYAAAAPQLRPALEDFSPAHAREWSEALGEPTFVGSSGRVFPRSFKASPLLRAWLRRLAFSGVGFRLRHRWDGWTEHGALRFATPSGPEQVDADACVLALGGASWPKLGADGGWADMLRENGIAVSSLRPANCGFLVEWSKAFAQKFEGVPLQNAAFGFAGETVRGDAMVTRDGLEGGAIYALSAALREAIAARGPATLVIDLRPDRSEAELLARWERRRPKDSLGTALRKTLHLSPVGIGLLHEAARGGRPLSGLPARDLVARIRALSVRLDGPAPLARAISTAGGLALDEIDADFMLRRRPGTFVSGEMLDWEAPTGGYLLQACFATGAAAARGALRRLGLADDAGGVARRVTD